MDMESFSGLIKEYLKAIMLMIRNRDMESIFGLMADCIRESGLMASNMELVIILIHRESLRRVSGVMARKLSGLSDYSYHHITFYSLIFLIFFHSPNSKFQYFYFLLLYPMQSNFIR
jgi:hypothetical protein